MVQLENGPGIIDLELIWMKPDRRKALRVWRNHARDPREAGWFWRNVFNVVCGIHTLIPASDSSLYPSNEGNTMNNSQKIALVTGATRGIGLETVRQLAQTGATVFLAGRDPERAKVAVQRLAADGLSVTPIVLDVTDSASIHQAAAEVKSLYGKLDILVNNAGVLLDAMDRLPSEQSLESWRETFETNVYGVIEVTQAFLPLLKAAPAARIVNLSSQLASLAMHVDPSSPIYGFKSPVAYNASKSAINSWTVHLAYELRDSPIKVNAVHPGYVQTDMNGGAGEVNVAIGAKSSVDMALLGQDGPTGTFTHLGKTLPW